MSERQPLIDGQFPQSRSWIQRLKYRLFSHTPFSRSERAALQAFFAVVLLIVLIAAALHIAFSPDYYPYPDPDRPEHGHKPGHGHGKKDELCLTPDCVEYAAEVLQYIDPTVDPCDDFYQFANGRWLASHPVPPGKGFFGAAQDITERNGKVLTKILTSDIDKKLNASDQKILENLIGFYNTCTDRKTINKKGATPLVKELESVVSHFKGSSSHPKTPKTRVQMLTASLLYVQTRGVPVFFDFAAQGDVMQDPNYLILWAGEGELGLPSQDLYEDPELLSNYTTALHDTLAHLVEEIPTTHFSTSTKTLASNIANLESQLAKHQYTLEESANPYKTYNKRNPYEFAQMLPFINTDDFFSGLSPRPSHPADPIIVMNPDYYSNLTQIIDKTDTETLQAYILIRTIQKYREYVSKNAPLVNRLNKFYDNLEGISDLGESEEEIAKECTKKVTDLYGFAIGRYYVQKLFGGDSKDYAESVIKSIIQSFQDRLPELDWLDDETRQLAKEKAAAITYKIGYPTTPDTMNPDKLLNYFTLDGDFPIDTHDYFSNAVKHLRASEFLKWQHVHKQRDVGEWDMVPSEVNAYYNPEANEIAFPAGILQTPYFDPRMPEYMAFGVFGATAGHEITHAFDNSGSLYDKTGRLNKWMSDHSLDQFNNLTQCIVNQYSHYYVVDEKGNKVYVRSKQTIGEDTADSGGVSQAYRAWNDRRNAGHDVYGNFLLPGLNYTREQLFFIAFARGWWRNVRPATAGMLVRTDVHSPTNIRVIGTFSNNEDFVKAFNCPIGSPMNRPDKCKVW